MKLLLHATDFRAKGDVAAWALGFASFECLSARNRTVRRREHTDGALLAGVPADQPSPEDCAIHEDLRAAAIQLVGTLRPQDVDTLSAAFAGPRPMFNATLRKRLQRALDRLRRAWRKTYGNDE